ACCVRVAAAVPQTHSPSPSAGARRQLNPTGDDRNDEKQAHRSQRPFVRAARAAVRGRIVCRPDRARGQARRCHRCGRGPGHPQCCPSGRRSQVGGGAWRQGRAAHAADARERQGDRGKTAVNRKYTAAHLAFIKRRRRMPRRDLLVAFRRKFRRSGMTLLRLQDLCNRYGWGAGSRKGRFKGRSRRYSKAELSFIRRRRKIPRRELHAAFVETFRRRDVSFNNIKQLCTRRGWATDPRQRRRRTKGRTKFSSAERRFLRRRQKMPRRELYAAFVEKFQRAISLDGFKALCDRLGLRTGRTGRFEKGIVPANKGKRMPFNANSARTRFKKGQLPKNTKWLGRERLSKEGYVEISVKQRNPHTGFERRYVLKHRWLWEQKHGPVPEGMVLKCKGDRLDTDPSNWELIPRGVLPRLSGRFGRNYDDAPAELKPTIMAVAKLEQQLFETRRRSSAQRNAA